MSEEKITHLAGQLLVLTLGEYEDNGVVAVARVLKDFDLDERVAEWVRQNPEQVHDWKFDVDAFREWLAGQGLVELLDWDERNVTDILDALRAEQYRQEKAAQAAALGMRK
jgi:P2-related tail formation protein